MLPINFAAVFVSAVVAFVLGFLFHGPVSGKLWMKLANIVPTGNEKLSDMVPQMLWNLVVNIITAFVLANIVFVSAVYHGTEGSILGGMVTAFWVCLGFIITSSAVGVIWMGQSLKLWLFESVSSLISFIVMGAILANW